MEANLGQRSLGLRKEQWQVLSVKAENSVSASPRVAMLKVLELEHLTPEGSRRNLTVTSL